jgi:hypothetical protein
VLRALASSTSTATLGVLLPARMPLIMGELTPLSAESLASSPRVGPLRLNSICSTEGSRPLPLQCRHLMGVES